MAASHPIHSTQRIEELPAPRRHSAPHGIPRGGETAHRVDPQPGMAISASAATPHLAVGQALAGPLAGTRPGAPRAFTPSVCASRQPSAAFRLEASCTTGPDEPTRLCTFLSFVMLRDSRRLSRRRECFEPSPAAKEKPGRAQATSVRAARRGSRSQRRRSDHPLEKIHLRPVSYRAQRSRRVERRRCAVPAPQFRFRPSRGCMGEKGGDAIRCGCTSFTPSPHRSPNAASI